MQWFEACSKNSNERARRRTRGKPNWLIETLIESVDHHVEEEEGEMFRFIEENYSEQELEEIGRQIEERKKALGRQMAA